MDDTPPGETDRARLRTSRVSVIRRRPEGVVLNSAWPMVGTTSAMHALGERLERIAGSSRPVLVTGPTGAGKEVAVRALHQWGAHPEAPFIGIDCGAIPEFLMEDELFGHERGAFTGADRKREGYFEEVGSGTVFFDEIAELPLRMQVKLLRVLETGRFRPLGGGAERAFCGRIVAATHANLAERVADREFREDLYYRLHVLTVRVPALSERRDDIPLLVLHFLQNQETQFRVSDAAMEMLVSYSWPGNVRQLRNVIDRVVLFADKGVLNESIVRAELTGEGDSRPPPATEFTGSPSMREIAKTILAMPGENKFSELEAALFDEAVRQAQGNKSAAARLLGVHRKVVERRSDPRAGRGETIDPKAAVDDRILCHTLREK